MGEIKGKKVLIRIYGGDFDEYDEEIKKRYEEVE